MTGASPFTVISSPVRTKSPTSKKEVVNDVDEMESPNLLPASEEALWKTEQTLDLCLGPAYETRDYYSFEGSVVDISQGFQPLADGRFNLIPI